MGLFGKKQVTTCDMVTVPAYAKINLTLDVLGRREDGYHTVKMVMQQIALHDDVKVTVTHGEKKPEGIRLTCSLHYLPSDSRNIAHRAAELFYETTGVLLETVDIEIEKRIPVSAGLAGGSTDAAAVLVALNDLHGTGLSMDALCEMGLKLGADVPFCLRGGTMLAEGIGEKLTALPACPACFLVLCKPPFAVSTRDIYEKIDNIDIQKRPDTDGMLHALQANDYLGVCDKLYNVMETVTASKRRQIAEIHETLRENGADGTVMSGSGPTVYGLFSDENRAKTAAKMLSHRFSDTILTEIFAPKK